MHPCRRWVRSDDKRRDAASLDDGRQQHAPSTGRAAVAPPPSLSAHAASAHAASATPVSASIGGNGSTPAQDAAAAPARAHLVRAAAIVASTSSPAVGGASQEEDTRGGVGGQQRKAAERQQQQRQRLSSSLASPGGLAASCSVSCPSGRNTPPPHAHLSTGAASPVVLATPGPPASQQQSLTERASTPVVQVSLVDQPAAAAATPSPLQPVASHRVNAARSGSQATTRGAAQQGKAAGAAQQGKAAGAVKRRNVGTHQAAGGASAPAAAASSSDGDDIMQLLRAHNSKVRAATTPVNGPAPRRTASRRYGNGSGERARSGPSLHPERWAANAEINDLIAQQQAANPVAIS